MKKVLLSLAVLAAGTLSAQRYLSESFQVKVTSGVKYGTNVDLLKNLDILADFQANPSQTVMESTQLKTAVANGTPIDPKFYDPGDASTIIKVSDVNMDIYEPMNDTMTDRPVVVYLHTGNFLPPQINGSLAGARSDSSVVEICKRMARRGFVAVAISYRLGWDPTASGATGVVVRRSTLLNAVYRAIHDAKKAVRTLKDDAAGANTYGIDPAKITLLGEGSGGYVALAYATLDKTAETEIQKFVFPGTTDSSYVQPALVGDIDGFGGLLNLYPNSSTSADVDMVINLGGALADTSWLEAGDVPMVSFHAVRDPFAPFDEGTVVVPTTNEQVVDVQGANVFIAKANAVGNNTAMNAATYNDPYSAVARAKYGVTYDYFNNSSITVRSNVEGLFPILRPLVTGAANRYANQGSPWQYWATGLSMPSPNPKAEAKTFIDTIMGYSVPRMMVSLQLDGYLSIGLEENKLSKNFELYPNPTSAALTIEAQQGEKVELVEVFDLSGKQLISTKVDERKTTIDLRNYPAGIYVVKARVDGQTHSTKITKH
jgi:acetyl esterase/lipase